MSEEIKFDLDGDIIMQIEMDSYMKYNDTIASMNDHLGEIYGYSDVRDTEEAQLKYEKELAYKAILQLQQKVEQLEKENKELNLELSGYRQAILNDDNLMGLKLKIDKAITYIKIGKTFENKNTKKVVDTIQNDLLNILNKGSDK